MTDNRMNATWERLDLRASHRREGAEEVGDDSFFSSQTTATAAWGESTLLPWGPILCTVLCGVHDPSSPFHLLAGHEESLLRLIYEMIVEAWKDSVIIAPPSFAVGRMFDVLGSNDMEESTRDRDERGRDMMNVSFHRSSYSYLGPLVEDRPEIAFTRCGFVDFPPPNNRNVNMMPFVMGDIHSLPEDLQCYFPILSRCPIMEDEELGKVCYLTVQEGWVGRGDTQRRGGLHIEAPGQFRSDPHFLAGNEHNWGRGIALTPDELHGGLFIASNMAGTSAVWNALVDKSVVDSHGGIEPLRPFLGPPTQLEANELVWLTDRTPHEALKQSQEGYRQFFRLVTHEISFWLEEHSTPNPLTPLPSHIPIVEGSKFAPEKRDNQSQM